MINYMELIKLVRRQPAALLVDQCRCTLGKVQLVGTNTARNSVLTTDFIHPTKGSKYNDEEPVNDKLHGAHKFSMAAASCFVDRSMQVYMG